MIFLQIRRVLTCWNMIATGHRAIMVRTATTQLIHIAAPLVDTWEANQTTIPIKLYSAFYYSRKKLWTTGWCKCWNAYCCLHESWWRRPLLGLHGETAQYLECTLTQLAQTCESVQSGKVKSDETSQSDSSSTWGCSAAHESKCSMTSQRGHLFFTNIKKKSVSFNLSYPWGGKLLADTDCSIILQLTWCKTEEQ